MKFIDEDNFEVLDYYTKEERWSAYDTDMLHFAEVKIDGKIHTFREYSRFDPEERAVEFIRSFNRKKYNAQRRQDLMEKYKDGLISKEEAIELIGIMNRL